MKISYLIFITTGSSALTVKFCPDGLTTDQPSETLVLLFSAFQMDVENALQVAKVLDSQSFNFKHFYDSLVEPKGRQKQIFEICLSNPEVYRHLLSPGKLSVNPNMARHVLSGRYPRPNHSLGTKDLVTRTWNPSLCLALADFLISKQRLLIESFQWLNQCTKNMPEEQMAKFVSLIEPILTSDLIADSLGMYTPANASSKSLQDHPSFTKIRQLSVYSSGLAQFISIFPQSFPVESGQAWDPKIDGPDGLFVKTLNIFFEYLKDKKIAAECLPNVLAMLKFAKISETLFEKEAPRLIHVFDQMELTPLLAFSLYSNVSNPYLQILGLYERVTKTLRAHPEICPPELLDVVTRYSIWRHQLPYLTRRSALVRYDLDRDLLPQMTYEELLPLLVREIHDDASDEFGFICNYQLPFSVSLPDVQVSSYADLFISYAKYAVRTFDFLVDSTSSTIIHSELMLHRWLVFTQSWLYLLFQRQKLNISHILGFIPPGCEVCSFMKNFIFSPPKTGPGGSVREFNAEVQVVCVLRGFCRFHDFGTLYGLLNDTESRFDQRD